MSSTFLVCPTQRRKTQSFGSRRPSIKSSKAGTVHKLRRHAACERTRGSVILRADSARRISLRFCFGSGGILRFALNDDQRAFPSKQLKRIKPRFQPCRSIGCGRTAHQAAACPSPGRVYRNSAQAEIARIWPRYPGSSLGSRILIARFIKTRFASEPES